MYVYMLGAVPITRRVLVTKGSGYEGFWLRGVLVVNSNTVIFTLCDCIHVHVMWILRAVPIANRLLSVPVQEIRTEVRLRGACITPRIVRTLSWGSGWVLSRRGWGRVVRMFTLASIHFACCEICCVGGSVLLPS